MHFLHVIHEYIRAAHALNFLICFIFSVDCCKINHRLSGKEKKQSRLKLIKKKGGFDKWL